MLPVQIYIDLLIACGPAFLCIGGLLGLSFWLNWQDRNNDS